MKYRYFLTLNAIWVCRGDYSGIRTANALEKYFQALELSRNLAKFILKLGMAKGILKSHRYKEL